MIENENPLAQASREYKDNPAVIFAQRSITYRQLDAFTASTAKQLKKVGVRSGDRVAIIAPNSAEYVVMLFSLWRLGAVAVPISHRFPEQAVQNLLQRISCQLLLTSFLPMLSSKVITARRFLLEEMISMGAQDAFFDEGEPFDPKQEATIILTSGTSQEPKIVLHTYENHYWNAVGANENIPLDGNDRWLLSLPLFHVGGVGILFRCLLAGAAVVIPPPTEEMAVSIVKHRVTHVSLVSTQLFRLLQDPDFLSKVKFKAVLVGGGPLPANLLERAATLNWPIYATYGMTETASQIATSVPQEDRPDKLGTFVKVLPHRELKISQDNEILVRGKVLFKGYLDGSKLAVPFDAEGWFATGDVGSLNADDTLTVLGRKDNMFISGGENIYPEEIESLLCRVPQVRAALVVAVKDIEYFSRPVAILKTTPDFNLAETISFLERGVPRFKVPIAFYAWPANFEHDGLKVSRKRVADLISKGELTKFS